MYRARFNLTHLIAAVFIAVVASPIAAHNFALFLANPDFDVIQHRPTASGPQRPFIHPSAYGYDRGQTTHFIAERYYARDRFGKTYVLSMASPKQVYAEVSASILTTAIGLPSNVNYPVFVRRGENGVPPLLYARGNFQKVDSRSKFAPDDTLIPATLRPHFELDKISWDRTSSSPEKMAALVMQVSMNFLFSTRKWESYPEHDDAVFQNLGYIARRNAFVILNLEDAFSETRYRTGIMQDYFAEFPSKIVTTLSKKDQQAFYNALNLYLTRLEALNETDLSMIVEAGITNYDSHGRRSNEPLIENFAEHVQNLRFELYMLLASWHEPKDFLGETLLKPLNLASPPHVFLPPHIPRPQDPLPKLWDAYFDFTPSWASPLSPEAIASIIKAAKPLQSHISVWPQIDPEAGDGAHFRDNRSLQLNAHNQQTLVVHSSNDKEAENIFALSIEAGAHIIDLKLDHGGRMSEIELTRIVDLVRERNIKRIIAIELPSFKYTLRSSTLTLNGITVYDIDHHEYNGDGTTYHPYSSLEQLAHALGAMLTLSEQLTAWCDRGGLYGLAESGFDQHDIIKRFSSPRALLIKNAILASQMQAQITGPTDMRVHFLPDAPLRLFEYGVAMSGAYAERGYGRPVSRFSQDVVIMTRSFMPSILYSGPATITKQLDDALRSLARSKDFRYGDLGMHPVQSIYFHSKDDYQEALRIIFQVLRGESSSTQAFQVAEYEHQFAWRQFSTAFLRELMRDSANRHADAIGQLLLTAYSDLGRSLSHGDQEHLRQLHGAVVTEAQARSQDPDRLFAKIIKAGGKPMRADPVLSEYQTGSRSLLTNMHQAVLCSSGFRSP